MKRPQCRWAQSGQLLCQPKGIVSIAAVAIGQLTPAIEGQLEGILLLTLQRLQAEMSLQCQLIVRQMGLIHHPVEDGNQIRRVIAAAAQADQQSILVGFAAQPCPAAFDQIGDRIVVMGTTASG